ncbi:D(1C) dopamine receptor-like [Mya arenaria]|uniref:D(1C) dopamine receptor-like n=1 Tax=Mya arenaria TaxID=6604 RepID=UPI0022E1B0FA|nr:D(1C) dopamine receptor-like [Mya arenaria]XP_052771384.1 D(1C) dopamine receptor-like [Mya arenaria]
MGDSLLTTTTSSFEHTVNGPTGADNDMGLSNATEKELLDQLNDEIKRALTPVSVFVGIEAVVGFFGNLFVLYVFIKRYHDCNFRYFVLCLAFLDFISTLTTIPGEILTQQFWYKYPFPIVCKIKSFFNVFTVSGEALCLCIIAVDRYRKICAPFRWQIKPRQALIMCGVIYGAAFIISLPVSFLWGIHHDIRIYNGRNVTVTICEKDAKYADSRHPFEYATSVEVLIGICLIVMLILYILVAKKLILGRSLAQMRQNSRVPMVSKTTALQTKFKQPPEISDEVGISTSDVPTGNEKPNKETEMRSMDDESEPVDVNDVCLTDAETTCEGGTSEERNKKRVRRRRREIARRVRRKTYIMFVLTIIFIVTTILYLTLLAFISGGILNGLNDYEMAVYFFFFRLVFINHAINPFVYGCLDPQFKQILGDMKNVFKKGRKG